MVIVYSTTLFRYSLSHSLDDALDYLLKWTEQLEMFQQFSWADLRKFPDWITVKKSLQIMSSKTSFDLAANSSKIFQQFGLIKTFCTVERIHSWKQEKISTESRWVETFKHMEQRQFPFVEFSHIIEFILCFPGTSAPVERLFAKAKKIWTPEKSSLQPSTLKSMLIIKNNLDYDCSEFYRFLKTRPEILKQIQSQDKYDFKKPKAIADSSPGAMSIDLISEE